ncbi:MAG: PAS domain S-box protein, partial [Pseudorhodobacter sp.]|nr:PAS domain S-box protein [Pseudorhodobacter sp.]
MWSRKAKAIFGLPADADITHDLFVSLLQPGDVSTYRTAWAAALDPAGTGTYTLEYRIRRANDGHERWIDSTATVEFDKGRPIRVVGTLRDVTDEKNAALRSNRTERGKTAFATSPGFGELPVTPLPAGPDAVPANVLAFETASGIHPVADLFRTALQSLPLHIAVLDRAGTVVLVNKPWTDSAGYTGDRLSATMTVGANFRDVCRQSTTSTADAERVLSGIEGVLNGTLPLFEMEYACQDPVEQQWYTMTAAPLAASGGAIVSHDCITDRKRADRAVQASEVLFRATFDTAAVGMAHLTTDRRLLRANSQLCRLLGYDHSELCAMSTFQQIVHPDDRDIGVAHVEMMRAGGADTCRWQQRLLRKDGLVVWVMTGLGAVRQPSGALDYLVASVEDVSSLKLAEQRQDTLLHELAHRGKNLLSVIQAIANCSLSGERTLKDAKTVLIGRLQALATSYDTLTKVAFDGVLLDVILRNELRSFGGRVHIAGPPVKLTDKATQTIALIAHELA